MRSFTFQMKVPVQHINIAEIAILEFLISLQLFISLMFPLPK